jgi:acyl-CoA reductase-like NAD-dependent aldehyde dehydrogenase
MPSLKIENLSIRKQPFIDGSFVESSSGKFIDKISPSNGMILGGLASGNNADVNLAVNAAKKSFESRIWRDKNPKEKQLVLLKLADLIEQNLEELALLDTIETGRALNNYMYDSIPKAINSIRWFANAIDKIYDRTNSMRSNSFATFTREPIGILGIITPWNDPLVVAAWKFAPALLMGNSIIIKPAEQSSFSILKIAELSVEAGIPPGVFNVIPGYGDIAGKALALHKDVAGIFFTGSSATGKLIMQYAGASNMKKVSLECGGKSPFVVSNLCNQLKKSAEVLAKNIFYNQGQICSAPSRLVIHKDIKEEFINYLVVEALKFLPNDPFDIKSVVGCLISFDAKSRIEQFVKKAIKSGAKKIDINVSDVNVNKIPKMSIIPIILDDVDLNSDIADEEIFGPVLSVFTADNMEDALMIANHSKYGLASSIWTDNLNEAYKFTRLLESGIVHVNSYGDDDETAPFGGFKQSGFGKDKSIYAFNEYSNLKTVWTVFN